VTWNDTLNEPHQICVPFTVIIWDRAVDKRGKAKAFEVLLKWSDELYTYTIWEVEIFCWPMFNFCFIQEGHFPYISMFFLEKKYRKNKNVRKLTFNCKRNHMVRATAATQVYLPWKHGLFSVSLLPFRY